LLKDGKKNDKIRGKQMVEGNKWLTVSCTKII